MIVKAVFPAPVVHMPPRTRKARLTFARAEASVELARAPAAEFRPVCVLEDPVVGKPGALSIHEHRGLPWKRLTHAGGRPVAHAEWLEFLAWAPDAEIASTGFAREFERTPLVAAYRTGTGRQACATNSKGVPLDLAAQRQVARDGRDEAARALARFLDEEIVLTEDGVMARYHPLANQNGGGRSMVYSDQAIWAGCVFPPVRPDRVEEALAFWGHRPYERAAAVVSESLLANRRAFAGLDRLDDDLAFVANRLPGKVAGFFEDQASSRLAFGRAEAMAAGSRRLAEMEAVGALGGYQVADAPAMLDELQGLIRTCLAAKPFHHARQDWEKMASYVDLLRENRLAPVAAEDADALEGLGMR